MATTRYFTNTNSSFKSGYYNNDGTSTTIDWSLADIQEFNLQESCELQFTGATAGQKLQLIIKQIGTQSHWVAFPENVRWENPSESPHVFSQSGTTYSLDERFHTGVINNLFDNRVFDLVKQSDGRFIAVGQFQNFDTTSSNYIARIDLEGNLDPTFNIGTGFNLQSNCIKIQSDGKILVGGTFTSYNGTTVGRIVRLNTDGTLDGTFVTGTGFDNNVKDIELLSDGSIIVVGDFTLYDGSTAPGILKLDSVGTPDSTFKSNLGTGFTYGGAYTCTVQSDDKIIVGGNFTDFDGTTYNGIIRINTTGIKDNSFLSAGFDNTVNKIIELSSGDLIVGGYFQTHDPGGTPSTCNYICKLYSNGSIHPDTTTNSPGGFDGNVNIIILHPDGRIIVGGNFTTYNSMDTANNLCFLNQDLTFNSNIAEDVGFYPEIFTVELQRYNKLMVGGDFTQYGLFTSAYRFAMIRLEGSKYTRLNFVYNGDYFIGDVNSI